VRTNHAPHDCLMVDSAAPEPDLPAMPRQSRRVLRRRAAYGECGSVLSHHRNAQVEQAQIDPARMCRPLQFARQPRAARRRLR
jgi:hypothetical protein